MTGEELWSKRQGFLATNPAADTSALFVAVRQGSANILLALDLHDGAERWSQQLSDGQGIGSRLAISDSEVIVLGRDGDVASFGLDGTPIWSGTLDGVSEPLSEVTIADGTLMANSDVELLVFR